MLNKITNWFITSSVNPDQTSMTLQSLLMAGAGTVVSDLQSLGLNVSITTYTNEIGHAATVLGLVLAGVGFIRKVFLSLNKTTSATVAV